MFFGEYEHQLDDKNRIRIPSKLKLSLGKEYFFMKGTTKSISVYPISKLEEYVSKFKNISSLDKEAQESLSMVLGSIKVAEEDGQGRVNLPDTLRAYAEINKDIVSVGMIDHIDIYSKEERTRLENEKNYTDRLALLKEKVEG